MCYQGEDWSNTSGWEGKADSVALFEKFSQIMVEYLYLKVMFWFILIASV